MNRTLIYAASLLIASATPAFAFVIDDFDTGDGTFTDALADGITVTGSMDGSGILGGQRDIIVNNFSQRSGTGDATLSVANGFLNASSAAGVEADFTIQWDGTADGGSPDFDVDGLGSIDFLAASNGFNIDLDFSDINSRFDITSCSNAGAICLSASFDFLGFPDGGTRFIGWDDPAFDPSVDFSDISAFQTEIFGDVAFDLIIDEVVTNEVPAPGAPMLLGLGLGLLGLARTLNKK